MERTLTVSSFVERCHSLIGHHQLAHRFNRVEHRLRAVEVLALVVSQATVLEHLA